MATLVQKVMAETLGVFVFFMAIFTATKPAWTPFAVALGLLVAVLIFGDVSGGHFNFTVTLTKLVEGSIGATEAAGYGLGQLLGGVMALYVAKNLVAPAVASA